ncbi:hypothetical protein [Rhodobacter sp. NTK016B]|nr:hypothetical protein [Rhodobacter sp. NTK016B]
MNFGVDKPPDQAAKLNGFQGIPTEVEEITVLRQLGIGKAGFEGAFDA